MGKYFLILMVVIGIIIIIYNKKKKQSITDEEKYINFLKTINKAFNNVLICVNDIPKLKNKTLVRLNHIDDLVDISEKVKKPIFYIEGNESCDFILLNKEEYCIYTLKVNEEVESSFDKYYKSYVEENENNNTKILEDLDKTTIIKISDGSSFKVSPLKEKDIREMKEKEFLKSLKEEMLPKLK